MVGLWGAGGVKNFSVWICDGASSTARSSFGIGLKFPSYRIAFKLIANVRQLNCHLFWYKVNGFFVEAN